MWKLYEWCGKWEARLKTRNPAEVISIPKRFIGAWRLSDPSVVTIFGWHLAKKPNLVVPPLTAIPFCRGWHLDPSMFPCEFYRHTLLEKPLPRLISIQVHTPWPPSFPPLICVVGFIITLATHECTMLRNHLCALQCLVRRVKAIKKAVNDTHDGKIHKATHLQNTHDHEIHAFVHLYDAVHVLTEIMVSDVHSSCPWAAHVCRLLQPDSLMSYLAWTRF